jgi:hypothetical protein
MQPLSGELIAMYYPEHFSNFELGLDEKSIETKITELVKPRQIPLRQQ